MRGKEIKEKLEDFNKRFDIVEKSEYAEEFRKFKQRVLNNIGGLLETSYIGNEAVAEFCAILGIEFKYYQHDIIPYELIKENDEKKFYRLLQLVSILKIPKFDMSNIAFASNVTKKSLIYKGLKTALDFSKVNLEISFIDDEIIFYPKGEKKLDKKLIDEVLKFSNLDSSLHFKEALKFYFEKNPRSFIKAAESLRRSLEEFLRFKLSNTKGLKENILVLSNRLKSDGNDKAIRKIVFQIFNYLDDYFNENSKHNDGDIDEIECEYLIYQTGLLLRYISKLNFIS